MAAAGAARRARRFTAAFENADADALAELLRKDAVLEMPPLFEWFDGRDAIRAFFAAQVLTEPLAPGSTVITMSSGAALAGSPLSGGYAGAKAAIRFLTSYAASEAERDGLGIRFVSVLPQLTPATALGAAAVAAYAARAGADEASYAASLGATPAPELAGQAVASLATDPSLDQPAYLLTGAGLRPVG